MRQGKLTIEAEVPFNTEAEIHLPDACVDEIRNIASDMDGIIGIRQEDSDVMLIVLAGTYSFTYRPTKPYRKIYSLDSLMSDLNENPKTKAILDEYFYSEYKAIPFEKELFTLRQMLNGPFTYLPYDKQEKIDRLLREVE